MNLFWLEYLYFIVSIFAILVGISTAFLFILTVRAEKQLRTVWRPLGFFLLAVAFFMFILERKCAFLGIFALLLQFLGFFSIFNGVLAEPDLSQLQVDPNQKTKEEKKEKPNPKLERIKSFFLPILFVLLLIFFLTYIFINEYIGSALLLGTTIFIGATIPIQIRRYMKGGKDKKTKRQNLYPLVGYVFLLFAAALFILYRLPDLPIVALYKAKLQYGVVWQIALMFNFLGFLFLAIWAWNFIKLRVFLRTYVIFLVVAIVVSSLGSLVFTTLIFRIVEINNLDLMARGAQTQKVILDERANTALFIAKTIANSNKIQDNTSAKKYEDLFEVSEQFFQDSGIDTLRIYNNNSEVLVSVSDPREKGYLYDDDILVNIALEEKKHVKSFYTEEGVLSSVVTARALSPIFKGKDMVGAIEVGYKFDNAFVDFSKEKTGLDVTMYAGLKRSATTIKTLDNVSRWTGSEETSKEVIEKVINKGNSISITTDRLGIIYYSAYEPIRNIEGTIIGMVSVGVPTIVLFENTRQQLVSTFLIMTIISILVAMLAYYAISRFQKK